MQSVPGRRKRSWFIVWSPLSCLVPRLAFLPIVKGGLLTSPTIVVEPSVSRQLCRNRILFVLFCWPVIGCTGVDDCYITSLSGDAPHLGPLPLTSSLRHFSQMSVRTSPSGSEGWVLVPVLHRK